ncbi:MAG: hypothetical protein IKU63_02100 [Bacteroidaceae bacterium]|nr:hypothetical protein [Bacteroidaceae bacterium]
MGKHILITSIPSWNQKSGANTWATLFERFDSNDLANIYIRPEIPDSTVCSRYFNIREWLVVKSILKRDEITGFVVQKKENNITIELEKEQQKTTHYSKNRKRIYLWMRELAWKLGKWKSKELDSFLIDFNPEVLFFSIESYPYFNRVNEYIIKKCKPKKVIGYLWDDNFTYKQRPGNIFNIIERYFLRKQVKRIVNTCTHILSISPKMKEECDKEFGINSILLTKPLRDNIVSPYRYKGGVIRLLYTGSLVIGRDKVLKLVAQAVDKINVESIRMKLDIYTNTAINNNYKQEINNYKGCELHGAIPQNQVFVEQENADVLIFGESLDKGNNIARLSFSTKITDYLSSFRCILAIGPADNSSIDYFAREDAAFVCTKAEDVYTSLLQIAETPTILNEYAEKAYKCGNKNHNPQIVNKKLKQIIYT